MEAISAPRSIDGPAHNNLATQVEPVTESSRSRVYIVYCSGIEQVDRYRKDQLATDDELLNISDDDVMVGEEREQAPGNAWLIRTAHRHEQRLHW